MAQVATDTRNDSYFSLEELAEKQLAVYNVVYQYGPISNKEIAKKLRWPINSVTGRTNELVTAGAVVPRGKEVDPATKKTVVLWQAVRAGAKRAKPACRVTADRLQAGIAKLESYLERSSTVDQVSGWVSPVEASEDNWINELHRLEAAHHWLKIITEG